jgi:hypothetical protein
MTTASNTTHGWNDGMKISLHDKLRQDLKNSMLAKNEAVKGAIRIIISEFPKLTVPITLESGKKTTRLKKPEEITNDDVLNTIRGLTKSEKTTLELKKEDTSEYLQILETYMPQLASAEEITAWTKENINFADYKSPMQAMGTIMKHFGKKADGNAVKAILQEMN